MRKTSMNIKNIDYKFLIAATILLSILSTMGYIIYRDNAKSEYCGKIVRMYETQAGYKVRPKKHIVFYNHKLKRNIDIEISDNDYCNLHNEQTVCYMLSDAVLNK